MTNGGELKIIRNQKEVARECQSPNLNTLEPLPKTLEVFLTDTVAQNQTLNTSKFYKGKFLKVDAVSARLDVPKSTIYEAVRQNRIGGVVKLGRKVRFDPDKFEAWLEAGGEALPGGWRREEGES